LDLEAFDSRFRAYVEQRFGQQANAIPQRAPQMAQADTTRGISALLARGTSSPFTEAMRAGQEALEAGRFDEARAQFERAKTLFPEYAGPQSPYRFLADIHLREDRPADAATELETIALLNERAYDVNVQLAELHERLGNTARAAAALERIVYIWPFDIALHRKLADLYEQLGELDKVVHARRAIVALEPVDRAEALYRLAVAYFEAGDRANARRQVLRALEIAPNYGEAQ